MALYHRISKLGSPKVKATKILFTKILFEPFKPTNPSVRMAYKGQSSFGIFAIYLLDTYQACKTLFRPIIPTNPPVWMIYKGQSSYGITAILYAYWVGKTLFKPVNSPIHLISSNGLQRQEQFWKALCKISGRHNHKLSLYMLYTEEIVYTSCTCNSYLNLYNLIN